MGRQLGHRQRDLMIPIIWTKAATTDLEQHYSFLEPISSDTAKKAVQAIFKAGESLKENPRRGAVVLRANENKRYWSSSLQIQLSQYSVLVNFLVLPHKPHCVAISNPIALKASS
jgi:plasmid stabilization system protein ParE